MDMISQPIMLHNNKHTLKERINLVSIYKSKIEQVYLFSLIRRHLSNYIRLIQITEENNKKRQP